MTNSERERKSTDVSPKMTPMLELSHKDLKANYNSVPEDIGKHVGRNYKNRTKWKFYN